jgi:hypothetical protein
MSTKQAYFVEFALRSETFARIKARGIVLQNQPRATIAIVDEASQSMQLVGLALQRNFATEFYRIQGIPIKAEDVAIMFYPVPNEMLAQLAQVYQEQQQDV